MALNRQTLVLGDATIDVFPKINKSAQVPESLQASIMEGGTGLNLAIGMAKLGGAVSFLNSFSNDSFGKYLQKRLRILGIKIIKTPPSKLPTRIVAVLTDQYGDHTFSGTPGRTADEELFLKDRFDFLRNTTLVLISGALLRSEPAKGTVLNTIRRAAILDIPIALDLSIRERSAENWLGYRSALEMAFAPAKIVLGTEEEFSAISYGTKTNRAKGQIVIKKLGRFGCIVESDHGNLRIPAFKIRAIDSTAAGDGFTAAFAVAWLNHKSLTESCMIANAAGALTCTRVGSSASLPTLQELRRFAQHIR